MRNNEFLTGGWLWSVSSSSRVPNIRGSADAAADFLAGTGGKARKRPRHAFSSASCLQPRIELAREEVGPAGRCHRGEVGPQESNSSPQLTNRLWVLDCWDVLASVLTAVAIFVLVLDGNPRIAVDEVKSIGIKEMILCLEEK